MFLSLSEILVEYNNPISLPNHVLRARELCERELVDSHPSKERKKVQYFLVLKRLFFFLM